MTTTTLYIDAPSTLSDADLRDAINRLDSVVSHGTARAMREKSQRLRALKAERTAREMGRRRDAFRFAMGLVEDALVDGRIQREDAHRVLRVLETAR
jgi:hypothetical protein